MEWWSAQLGLQRHMQTHKATHTHTHVCVLHTQCDTSGLDAVMFPLSIFLFSWTAWSLLSFNFCSQSFCPNGGLSWARCSTRRSVSSSGKVSLFVPSSVGSQSVHQPRHQHTHARARVSTSPPLTGRCHLRRQLQSLVWLLSSNQRPSSLSTATWPWGYHCHTVYTRLQLTPPQRHISYTDSSIWGRRKQEV